MKPMQFTLKCKCGKVADVDTTTKGKIVVYCRCGIAEVVNP